MICIGCQKENRHPFKEQVQISWIKETLQLFYEQQNPNKSGGEVLGTGSPDWEKTEFDNQSGLVFCEMMLDDAKAKKILVGETDAAGAITGASFYIFISNSADHANIDPMVVISNAAIGKKNMPDSFTGAVLKYSLNNELIFGRDFKEGMQTDNRNLIVQKPPHDTSAYNPPAPECLGDWVTTDWYLVTFDEEGNLIDEEYLYSTSYCTDWGGGGGGGGAGELEAGIMDFKSKYDIHTVTENEIPELLTETSEKRTKKYSWICGRALLIHAKSLEYGTHKKVNNEWQWESLTHQSVAIIGVVLGGSVSITSDSGQATLGIYNAIMDIDYTLHYNAIIPGFSPVNWSVTKSVASAWNVND